MLVGISLFMGRIPIFINAICSVVITKKNKRNISNFCQSSISLYFYTTMTRSKQLLIFLVKHRLQSPDKAMKGFVHCTISLRSNCITVYSYVLHETFKENHE